MPNIESVSIGALSTHIIEEMVRGERLVRRLRLPVLGPSHGLTGVLISPRMQAKLSLTVMKTETSSMLLGLFGGESTQDVIANIRLSFELRPTPDRDTRVMPEFWFSLVVPPFLRYRRQNEVEFVDFLVSEQWWFTGRRSPGAGLEIYDKEGQLLSSGESYSVAGLAAVLDRTARWVREGATGPVKRFDLDTQGAVGELMRRIAGYHQQVIAALVDMPEDSGVRSKRTNSVADLPAFDCSYRITDVHAKALLQLDGEGRLIEGSHQKESDDWQQLDFEIRPGTRGVLTSLQIAIRPPDFLVPGGKYHTEFLEALQTDGALGILWEAFSQGDKATFEAFLRNASQSERALLVRIDGKDHDLVLLAGPLGGRASRLLFLVQFEVTEFPSVAPKVANARFLAREEGPGPWIPERVTEGEAAQMIDRYLTRVFRTTLGWLRGVVP